MGVIVISRIERWEDWVNKERGGGGGGGKGTGKEGMRGEILQ